MLLACWPDRDLNVLPQGGEELHEALDREDTGAVSHQSGDVWLPDPKNLAGFGLRNAALLDEAVNLQREFGSQQFLLRMWQAEIGKHVPAASLHRSLRHSGSSHPNRFFRFSSHVSFASLCEAFRLRSTAGEHGASHSYTYIRIFV